MAAIPPTRGERQIGRPSLSGGAFRPAQLAVLSLATLAACEASPPEQYQVGSTRYSIPADHLSAGRTEPEVFIRIRAPERGYELVFDQRTSGKFDDRGNPVVFSISDSAGQQLRYLRSDAGTIVRRGGANPYAGCGTSMEVPGATWSLLIPSGRLPEARRIAKQARADLRSYQMR